MTAVTLIGLEMEPSKNMASPEVALPKWRVNDSSPRTTCSTAASTCFAAVARSSTSAASSHRPALWAAHRGDAFATANAVPRNVRRRITRAPLQADNNGDKKTGSRWKRASWHEAQSQWSHYYANPFRERQPRRADSG